MRRSAASAPTEPMKATDEVAPGILLIDKPEGPTSHDVVAEVRRSVGTRRVGHTGTLDPFASGLLILCIGKATRLVEYFHMLPKRYEARLLLGRETDTDDRTGRETSVSDAWRELDEEALLAATAARAMGVTMALIPVPGGGEGRARADSGDRPFDPGARVDSPPTVDRGFRVDGHVRARSGPRSGA